MGDLRALSVTQQVGLLFVTIFGLLILTTLVALSRSLRERTATQQATYWRFRRDLRAVVICPSNPFVSVDPIHAVPGMRTTSTIAARSAPASRTTNHTKKIVNSTLSAPVMRCVMKCRVDRRGEP